MKTLFMTTSALLFLLWSLSSTSANEFSWRPCPELSSSLQFPCRCRVEPFTLKPQLGAVSVDCDYVVFQTESPILPSGAPIISYSQRYSGQQILPTQVRTTKVYFSLNNNFRYTTKLIFLLHTPPWICRKQSDYTNLLFSFSLWSFDSLKTDLFVNEFQCDCARHWMNELFMDKNIIKH